MARSGQIWDVGGAVKWHRVGDREYPGWPLVRDAFAMNERRGWRRDLAKYLGLPPPNLTRLLRTPKLPNYEDYLGVLSFLERQGVRIVLHLTGTESERISGTNDSSPLPQ